jgi:hypothetical protein
VNGNLFVADNGSPPRVVKFDRRGRFVAQTASSASSNDALRSAHSLAADRSGNVYVADAESSRIAMFDNGLTPRALFHGIGEPWALCIAPAPNEYLYSASNPDKDDGGRFHTIGEVFQLSLDGAILGHARGDAPTRGTFPTLHHLDCRRPDELIGVGITDYFARIKIGQ